VTELFPSRSAGNVRRQPAVEADVAANTRVNRSASPNICRIGPNIRPARTVDSAAFMEEKPTDQVRLEKLRFEVKTLCDALLSLTNQHERIAARIAHLSERLARRTGSRFIAPDKTSFPPGS
jgi:hypothetical protein